HPALDHLLSGAEDIGSSPASTLEPGRPDRRCRTRGAPRPMPRLGEECDLPLDEINSTKKARRPAAIWLEFGEEQFRRPEGWAKGATNGIDPPHPMMTGVLP